MQNEEVFNVNGSEGNTICGHLLCVSAWGGIRTSVQQTHSFMNILPSVTDTNFASALTVFIDSSIAL